MPGVPQAVTDEWLDSVLANLPFALTDAQRRALNDVRSDMAHSLPMNRLLQGDVGAGKTLVAFMALLVAVEAGGQGVMMAPTELLARQHLASLKPLAEAAGSDVYDVLIGKASPGPNDVFLLPHFGDATAV